MVVLACVFVGQLRQIKQDVQVFCEEMFTEHLYISPVSALYTQN